MSEDLTIRELVLLDWCARELFDSDVVPLLIFVQNRPRPEGHQVRLVQRIGSKRDLVECARNPEHCDQHACLMPWDDFAALSEVTWPLEVRPEDAQVLRRLMAYRRPNGGWEARRGVEVGAEGAVAQQPTRGHTPMLVGSDITALGLLVPERYVDLQTVSNPSLWRGDQAELPPEIVACPEINITLNAAVFDPRELAAQNSVTLAWPNGNGPLSAHALAALINSSVSRYFAFLVLRSGVTGGGRRDYTIYPRTLKALPVPDLNDAQAEELADLSRQAHELGRIAAQDQLLLWQEMVGTAQHTQRVAHWGVDFSGWDQGAQPRLDAIQPELTEDNRLVLGPDATVRGSRPLLEYLGRTLEVAFADKPQLRRSAVQQLGVPPPSEAERIVAEYHKAIEQQEAAKEAYFRIVERIDEAVMDAFALSDDERAVIRRRMGEFPLNEHAAKYRVPWEQTRRPRLKQFEPGERFQP
jgi:hypothetical protein